jgi:hypothetical protein
MQKGVIMYGTIGALIFRKQPQHAVGRTTVSVNIISVQQRAGFMVSAWVLVTKKAARDVPCQTS